MAPSRFEGEGAATRKLLRGYNSLRSLQDRSREEMFGIGTVNKRSTENGEETLFLRGARAAPE